MTALIPLFAERILNSLPLGLLVAALAWACLRLGAYESSRVRFAVWFSALLTIAALPLLHHSPVRFPTTGHTAEITLPSYVAAFVFAGWAMLFCFASVRIVAGLWNIRALRNSSTALELDGCDALLRETIIRMENSHRVRVHVSEVQTVPAAIGFFRPIILIPGWALRELPASELRTILLHEFAHIERRDSWTNLAQKVIKAIFFFHPAVWWIDQRLCLEREMACDDAVLSATGDPQAYAACLVSLAERSFMQRSLVMAQALVSRVCETSLRVAKILKAGPRTNRIWKPGLALFGAVAAVGLTLVPTTPRFIAFEQSDATAKIAQSSPAIEHSAVPQTPSALPVRMETPVIPAAFKPTVNHHIDRRKKLASATPNLTQAAKVILAKAQQPPPAELFLVVRTAEYDGMGRALLSLTVWRVSLNPKSMPAEQNGALPKAI
jgi:beta-lactamase regulating signal transducer with metallopeptidase domain